MGFSAIIVAGGLGKRFRGDKPKQLYNLLGLKLWEWSYKQFENCKECKEIILVVPKEFKERFKLQHKPLKPFLITTGGEQRQDSVLNGLKAAKYEFVAIHDAARPLISQNLINKLQKASSKYNAAIPGIQVSETIKKSILIDKENFILETIPREDLYLIQTPQFFKKDKLTELIENSIACFTDDAALFEREKLPVFLVDGERINFKITNKEDLNMAEKLLSSNIRVGFGIDYHRFCDNKDLTIGGVKIPFTKGLQGHSDADVLTHAIIDAMLGASGEKDIGTFFPDNDPKYKNISSLILLKKTIELLKNPLIINIDCVIISEKPKFKPYIDKIIDSLSETLKIHPQKISVKATTTEKMGPEGREEGISVRAVVNLIIN